MKITSSRQRRSQRWTGLCAAMLCSVSGANAVITVTSLGDSGPGTLRQAIAEAGAGETVAFAVSGTVVLSSPLVIQRAVTVDAAGHAIEVSGGDAVRVFEVRPGVHFAIRQLKVTHGRSARGAGLYNDGGDVEAEGCTFWQNRARGADGTGTAPPSALGEAAYGGAIYNNAGELVLRDCTLNSNVAQGGAGAAAPDSINSSGFAGGNALGGAVYSHGSVRMWECVVEGNQALGGAGGAAYPIEGSGYGGTGGAAWGGGTWGSNDVRLAGCRLGGNLAVGGQGGNGYLGGRGGNAGGGGLLVNEGTAEVHDCSLVGNQVTAGYLGGTPREVTHGTAHGGAMSVGAGTTTVSGSLLISNLVSGEAASGGGLSESGGTLVVTACSMSYNRVAGYRASTYMGRAVSPSRGGGLHTEAATRMEGCTLTGNQVVGGDSGGAYLNEFPGGVAYGGGVSSHGTLEMAGCTVNGNGVIGGLGIAFGGPGSRSGNGCGGGIAVTAGSARLENCTVVTNAANGAAGVMAYSPGGSGQGGAIYLAAGSNTVQYCTVAGNGAFAGSGLPAGEANGGGLAVLAAANAFLRNTILAQSLSGGDVYGTHTGDHNLTGLDPRLGTLSFNGGPTWTMPLLTNSPAVDAGTVIAGLSMDQRGTVRPYGAGTDIGSFEWDAGRYTNFHLLTPERVRTGWRMTGTGPPGTAFRMQSSTNLVDWTGIWSGAMSVSGWFESAVPSDASAPRVFYRTISP